MALAIPVQEESREGQRCLAYRLKTRQAGTSTRRMDMKPKSISEAVRSGTARGISLALNPSIENYRRIRTPYRDVTAAAWEAVGRSMHEAMAEEESFQQQSRDSQ